MGLENRDTDDLLRELVSRGGSDLHLCAGLVPRIRLHGDLVPLSGWEELADSEVRAMLRRHVPPHRLTEFEGRKDMRFAFEVQGVGRFRASYFLHERGAAAVFRGVLGRVPSFKELGAPAVLERVCDLKRGLVLVAGPAGSGKTTTCAAMVACIAQRRLEHIVTVEDPVEFVFSNTRSVVTQREVGTDTRDMTFGLRAAMRQDASVLMVGDLSDPSVVLLALRAAEAGMLVIGTFTAHGAPRAIERLVSTFPSELRGQVRSRLAGSLCAVISQVLLRTVDGRNRVAAFEVLLCTPSLPGIIREGNEATLRSFIEGGGAVGMQSMDDALLALAQKGVVQKEEAWALAFHKSRFAGLVKQGGQGED